MAHVIGIVSGFGSLLPWGDDPYPPLLAVFDPNRKFAVLQLKDRRGRQKGFKSLGLESARFEFDGLAASGQGRDRPALLPDCTPPGGAMEPQLGSNSYSSKVAP
jgi:hypothetical protein